MCSHKSLWNLGSELVLEWQRSTWILASLRSAINNLVTIKLSPNWVESKIYLEQVRYCLHSFQWTPLQKIWAIALTLSNEHVPPVISPLLSYFLMFTISVLCSLDTETKLFSRFQSFSFDGTPVKAVFLSFRKETEGRSDLL